MNRRSCSAAILAALIGAVVAVWPSPMVWAERVCLWDADAFAHVCKIVRRAQPGGPAANVDIDGPGPLPIIWSRTLSSGLPGAPFDCYYEETVDGVINEVHGAGWAVFFTNAITGEIRLVGFDCEYPGEGPPQPPPVPPTPGDIAEQSRSLLALETGLSPSAERRGVSQLETWFWCEGADTVTLDPFLDGYSIDAEVGVDALRWDITGPDGHAVRTPTACGSRPDPSSDGSEAAARWTPNEPGVSSVVLTTTWSGSWTLTYTDPSLGAIELGTFAFPSVLVESAPFDYSVYEIQTVGVAP